MENIPRPLLCLYVVQNLPVAASFGDGERECAKAGVAHVPENQFTLLFPTRVLSVIGDLSTRDHHRSSI